MYAYIHTYIYTHAYTHFYTYRSCNLSLGNRAAPFIPMPKPKPVCRTY